MAKKPIAKIIKNRLPGIKDLELVDKTDSEMNIDLLMFSTKILKLKVILVDNLNKTVELEIWKDKTKKLKGWLREKGDLPLYIMWLSNDQFLILPAEPLANKFIKNYRTWMFEKVEDENGVGTLKYKTKESGNSESIILPIELLIEETRQAKSWAWNTINSLDLSLI